MFIGCGYYCRFYCHKLSSPGSVFCHKEFLFETVKFSDNSQTMKKLYRKKTVIKQIIFMSQSVNHYVTVCQSLCHSLSIIMSQSVNHVTVCQSLCHSLSIIMSQSVNHYVTVCQSLCHSLSIICHTWDFGILSIAKMEELVKYITFLNIGITETLD